MADTIKLGEYVIIQRQSYTKLHKFMNEEGTIMLGKQEIELKNIKGHNFFKTFQMKLKETTKRRRVYELEPCDNVTDMKEILQSVDCSGSDNRNIVDDRKSQILSHDEIKSIRGTVSDSKELIGTLIANSKSFNEKTEFSQEKYIKKKEKKYFDFIQVRKPTLRLLTEIFHRQDPEKALGLKLDTLSQLISYSGVNSNGKYLIFESGTSGLVNAAFLNSMGTSGDARLVHMHLGNSPQLQAVHALNLSEKQTNKCVSVNIYSVLRQFYQKDSAVEAEITTPLIDHEENQTINKTEEGEEEISLKRKHENIIDNDDDEEEENPTKRINIENNDTNEIETVSNNHNNKKRRLNKEERKQKWQRENDEAIEILKTKVDALTIVSKEDPFNIVMELLQFVNPGRPVVIFHSCKEVLMECYTELKSQTNLINLRLTTNFLRNYQVLPMRTHPHIQLQGNGGWLLAGYTVTNEVD